MPLELARGGPVLPYVLQDRRGNWEAWARLSPSQLAKTFGNVFQLLHLRDFGVCEALCYMGVSYPCQVCFGSVPRKPLGIQIRQE